METSTRLTAPRTGEQLTLFAGAFHANRIVRPGYEKGKKMNATCGRQCLESLAKSNRVGWLGKTFLAFLIGQMDWSSTRCYLTWKASVTKRYRRLTFRLRVSTLPTNGSAFGLLPTPVKSDSMVQMVNGYRTTAYNKLHNNGKRPSGVKIGSQLGWDVFLLPDQTGQRILDSGIVGTLNPCFVEWMMGFPEDWTMVNDSEP
nr:hypothetical protein [Fibrisoma montanum]